MSVQGSASRRLLGVDLPPRIAELVRRVESRAGQPVIELRGEHADVSVVVAFFDDTGRPFIALAEGTNPAPVEAVSLEVARLALRAGRVEKNMPYSEMRHPMNQRLCRRLYRAIEQEILAAECESRGVTARRWLSERAAASFLGPLVEGRYRKGEPDPGRLREGALDALEGVIALVDTCSAERFARAVAEADAAISRTFGLMYKVVEQHRPFEGDERVRAAYYLAVPFLFDVRRPTSPAAPKRR